MRLKPVLVTLIIVFIVLLCGLSARRYYQICGLDSIRALRDALKHQEKYDSLDPGESDTAKLATEYGAIFYLQNDSIRKYTRQGDSLVNIISANEQNSEVLRDAAKSLAIVNDKLQRSLIKLWESLPDNTGSDSIAILDASLNDSIKGVEIDISATVQKTTALLQQKLSGRIDTVDFYSEKANYFSHRAKSIRIVYLITSCVLYAKTIYWVLQDTSGKPVAYTSQHTFTYDGRSRLTLAQNKVHQKGKYRFQINLGNDLQPGVYLLSMYARGHRGDYYLVGKPVRTPEIYLY